LTERKGDESLEVVRSIAEERKRRIVSLIRNELSCKQTDTKKKLTKSEENCRTRKSSWSQFNILGGVQTSKRDRAASFCSSTEKGLIDHHLFVGRNVSTLSTEVVRRRKSLNDFVSESLRQKSVEFDKLKVGVLSGASEVLSSSQSSLNRRRALKKWLMSIQKGGSSIINETTMSPEQSSALCAREHFSGNEERYFLLLFLFDFVLRNIEKNLGL
jgi:hypothetical protein